MHVSSNCQGRQPRWRRPALAAMFIMTLAGLAGAAQAVEFQRRTGVHAKLRYLP